MTTQAARLDDDARAAVVAKIRDKARAIRMHALNMVFAARLGHPGGDLSVADILATLYFGVMRVDPKAPRAPTATG